MRDRDFYPAGAYSDPLAPWNQWEDDIERTAEIDVTWTRECPEGEEYAMADRLLADVRSREDVVDIDAGVDYDGGTGEVSVCATVRFKVMMHVCGSGRLTGDEDWDFDITELTEAAYEQYLDVLKVEQWRLDAA